MLKYCVDNMGLNNVRTQLFNGKAPAMRILKNASAIVLESSGDRIPEETHALLPQDALTDHKSYDPYTLDRLKQIDVSLAKFEESWQRNRLDCETGYYLGIVLGEQGAWPRTADVLVETDR